MLLQITNTFIPNTTIRSAEVNENFTDISTWADGNIGADNFAVLIEAIEFVLGGNEQALVITAGTTSEVIEITQTGAAHSLSITHSGNAAAVNVSQTGQDAGINVAQSGNAPGVKITHTGAAIESVKAALDVESTTKGFLPPRMTTTQRDAITSPPAGLQIYNVTVNRIELFDGTVWTSLADITQITPSGVISAYGGTSAPGGWLLCDGTQVSRATYANLFDAIGTAFGEGDGSTTFHTPDVRGRFLRAVDGGTTNDPDAASRAPLNTGGNTGDNVGSVQDDAFDSHQHPGSFATGGHNHGVSNAFGYFEAHSFAPSRDGFLWRRKGIGGWTSTFQWQPNSTPPTTSIGPTAIFKTDGLELGGTTDLPSATGGVDAAGGSETRPKNVYVNYIIKI